MKRRQSNPSKQSRTHAAISPVLEALEGRRLLSATLGTDGMLDVAGTKTHDVIRVSLNASDATQLDVTVNGTTSTFDLASVTAGVRVNGGKGNDDIRVDETNGAVSLSFTLLGDKGNDTLVGGSGNDLLDGGVGNDAVLGGAGNDRLLGGKGNDTASGQAGSDELHGDAGKDDLDGDEGDDDLFGGAGKDDVDGGEGHDSLDGGKGKDAVNGGTGRDRFHATDQREVEDRQADDDDDVLVDASQIPAAVRNAFNSLFSGATIHEVEMETEDAVAEYEFEFTTAEGQKGEAKFDAAGNLLEATLTLEQLPEAVRSALNIAFPGVTVLKVEMETEDNGSVEYEIEYLTADGQEGEAKFDAAGVLLEADLTLDQLPAEVRAAFESAFPAATVREIEMEREGGAAQYEFEFTTADGLALEAKFDAEGNLIEQEQDDGSDSIDEDDFSPDLLPAPVRAAFDDAFLGAAIGKIEVSMDDNELRYEFKFTTSDGVEGEAEFAADGTWLE